MLKELAKILEHEADNGFIQQVRSGMQSDRMQLKHIKSQLIQVLPYCRRNLSLCWKVQEWVTNCPVICPFTCNKGGAAKTSRGREDDEVGRLLRVMDKASEGLGGPCVAQHFRPEVFCVVLEIL